MTAEEKQERDNQLAQGELDAQRTVILLREDLRAAEIRLGQIQGRRAELAMIKEQSVADGVKEEGGHV